jgi:ferritin-like metal-binding protein YciE
MPELTKTVKDAVYVTVGLGVLGFQQAQVRRREFRQQLETQISETGDQLQKLAQRVESSLAPVRGIVEAGVPTSARDLVDKARQVAKDAQGQLRRRAA